MPKKKPENELTDKEQFERFKEKAKELEVDEKTAERAFRSISSRQDGKDNQSS